MSANSVPTKDSARRVLSALEDRVAMEKERTDMLAAKNCTKGTETLVPTGPLIPGIGDLFESLGRCFACILSTRIIMIFD